MSLKSSSANHSLTAAKRYVPIVLEVTVMVELVRDFSFKRIIWDRISMIHIFFIIHCKAIEQSPLKLESSVSLIPTFMKKFNKTNWNKRDL